MGTGWKNSSLLDCGIFLPLQRNQIFWKGMKTNYLETEIDTFMPFDRFSTVDFFKNFQRRLVTIYKCPAEGHWNRKSQPPKMPKRLPSGIKM